MHYINPQSPYVVCLYVLLQMLTVPAVCVCGRSRGGWLGLNESPLPPCSINYDNIKNIDDNYYYVMVLALSLSSSFALLIFSVSHIAYTSLLINLERGGGSVAHACTKRLFTLVTPQHCSKIIYQRSTT